MVVLVSGHLGQTALTAAVKENKQEIAVVPILHLQMAEKTAVEKSQGRSHATSRNAVSSVTDSWADDNSDNQHKINQSKLEDKICLHLIGGKDCRGKKSSSRSCNEEKCSKFSIGTYS